MPRTGRTFATVALVLACARPAAADCAAGAFCGGPRPEPGQPLPPPSVSDFGVAENATGRWGYKSGPKIGASIAFAYRTSTFPYGATFGMDALETTVQASLDHREIGWRLAPFGLIFSLTSESVFSNVYLRWNIVEFGGDYRTDIDASALSVGSQLAIGWTRALNDGVALRIFELGAFPGVYAKDKPFFDFGVNLSTGIIFR